MEAGVATVQAPAGQIVAALFTSTCARVVTPPAVAVIVISPACAGALCEPFAPIVPAEADHDGVTLTTAPFASRATAVNVCVSDGPNVTKCGATSSVATAEDCAVRVICT